MLSKLVISYKFPTNLEVLSIEITLSKIKILLLGLYITLEHYENFCCIWKTR